MRRFILLLFISSATLSATVTSKSAAQTLETITVTATRQQTELLSVGNNIAVLDGDTLAAVAHTHINESLARVPGAWISRGNGQEHLTAIRSPVLTGAGACGAFLMAEDGIALRAAGFCNLNQLFEVNTEQAGRIEVVRGPQSALYGSNAVHGTINVLSFTRPQENRSRLGLEFGPDDYYRLTAHQAWNTGDHALRLYGNATSDGGYKDDSGFDQQKINLSHYYEADGFSVKNHLSLSNLNQETAGFVTGRDAYKDEALKTVNPNPEAFRDAQSARFYSQLSWQRDDNTTLLLRPYLRHSDMRFLQHFLPWQPVEENGVDSAGLQIQYRVQGAVLDWTIGLDSEISDGFLEEVQAQPFAPHLPQGVHYDYDVDAVLLSPFVNAHWNLTEATSVNLALRFDHTEYDYSNNTGGNSACAAGVTNCRFTPPDSRSDSFNDWSPAIAVLHRLGESHSIYLNLSRGFRAPQATELYRLQAGQLVTDLDSERLDSIELGMRGEAAALSYQLSLYGMQKKDFIFQDSDRRNISGGESKHRGLELDLNLALSDKLSLAFSGTLARHQYDNTIRISDVDINGKDIDTAPRYSSNIRLLWNSSDKLRAELEWYRLGSYYQNPENTVKYPGHDLLNLRTSYRLTPRLTLGLRLINALDKDYAERADFGFGSDRYFVGQPRSVYASVALELP